MSDPMTDVPLASEFAPASLEQWRKLVDGVLRGAPFDRRLVAKTYDGLRIEPLYPRNASAVPVLGRAPGARWQVVQRLDHPDPATANLQARQDLENGATGLALVLAGSIGAHGFGLDPSEAALRRVLDGIHLDAGIALELDGGAPAAARGVAHIVSEHATKPSATRIRFGLDPLGLLARAGTAEAAWNEAAASHCGAIRSLVEQGFAGPFFATDGRIVHAGGGTEAQELGYVLACAVAYLRMLEDGGFALDQARRLIFFRLAADADQFLTIAKFRALRKLFARVEAACGLAAQPIFVSAETAWRMMTRRDPWVNVLRTTIATFAAGLGGADSVTVLPFTAALGLPDAFARRLARNTQLILLEESNLARVADPAAGSGGIEALTQQLCGAAWSFFQEIEAAGGAHAALASGLIARKVAAIRHEREAAVARGREPITGTSEFPDIHELPVAVLAPAPAHITAADGDVLPEVRLAEPFEQLRDAADAYAEETGARPKVFLAGLGTASDFTARTTFAKNFFEAGGIEAVTNDGFSYTEDLVAAFKASGIRLACLCSSNDVYAKEAVAAATALAKAGASHIYLAGRGGELENALKAAGVGTFIYSGCDVLATLRVAHDMISRS
ncbi:MAG TPA: methylmalonyl-CoA mutase subunit beta [Xanthobacteraceae bacterium]|jgi:methylmalonyl-CoA mutase|nr:methylmalonyl-CoA mutase subunit beta [Xanthobacteraceae bacterium]